MGYQVKNNTEENRSRAQRINALVGHHASLSIDGMFAVPPFPVKNDHFVPQLSKRKTQYKGLGIMNNLSKQTLKLPEKMLMV